MRLGVGRMVLFDKEREADKEVGFTYGDFPGQKHDRRKQCFIKFIKNWIASNEHIIKEGREGWMKEENATKFEKDKYIKIITIGKDYREKKEEVKPLRMSDKSQTQHKLRNIQNDILNNDENLKDVLRHYGHKEHKGANWECNYHKSKGKHSLSITGNVCNCVSPGCDLQGNVFSIIKLHDGDSKHEFYTKTLKTACSILGMDEAYETATGEMTEEDKKKLLEVGVRRDILIKAHTIFLLECQKHIGEIKDYIMGKRKITEEQLKSLKLGYLPHGKLAEIFEKIKTQVPNVDKYIKPIYYNNYIERIIHPHFFNNELINLTGEATTKTEKGKYVKMWISMAPNYGADIYLADNIRSKEDILIIAEGYWDALQLQLLNYPVITFGTCVIAGTFYNNYARYLRKFKKVIICFDAEENDSGINGATIMIKKLQPYKVNAYITQLRTPSGKIDVDDLIKNIVVADNKKRAVQEKIIDKAQTYFDFMVTITKEEKDLGEKDKLIMELIEIAFDYETIHKNRYKKIIMDEFRVNSTTYNEAERKIKKRRKDEEKERKKETAKKYQEEQSEGLKSVTIPSVGVRITDFVEEASEIIKEHKVDIFYRDINKKIVQVDMLLNKTKNGIVEECIGFSEIKDTHMINIIEQHMQTVINRENSDGEIYTRICSLKSNDARVALDSVVWRNKLRHVSRILTVPIPILYENELTFPKEGHDERFDTWLPYGAPKINETMEIDEAKDIIFEIYKEVAFEGTTIGDEDEKEKSDKTEKNQNKTNAIAHLLSAFCQGLYPTWNTRTPIAFYVGNQPGVGKDCTALIPAIVMEGDATENTAISTENKDSNDSELRKLFTGLIKEGKRRYHSSNNTGHISNTTLEAFSVSSKWGDRLLGGNLNIALPNEIFISMSANRGYTISTDFKRRHIAISLSSDRENINDRQFERPLIHEWVKKKRSDILSALYTLVRKWFNAGKPTGNCNFMSFSSWAKIVGGIMIHNDLGNPCIINEDVSVATDKITTDIKQLFELVCLTKKEKWLYLRDILAIMGESGDTSNWFNISFKKEEGTNNYDRSTTTAFGIAFKKCLERSFTLTYGDKKETIKIVVDKQNQKISSRVKYMFKIVKTKVYTVSIENTPECIPSLPSCSVHILDEKKETRNAFSASYAERRQKVEEGIEVYTTVKMPVDDSDEVFDEFKGGKK